MADGAYAMQGSSTRARGAPLRFTQEADAQRGRPERVVRVFSAFMDPENYEALVQGARSVFNQLWGTRLGIDERSLRLAEQKFPEGLLVAVDERTPDQALGAMLVIRRTVTQNRPMDELAVPLPHITGEYGKDYYGTHEPQGNGFICHRVAGMRGEGVAPLIVQYALRMAEELHPAEDRWVGPYSRPADYRMAVSGSAPGYDIITHLRTGKDGVIHKLHGGLGAKILGAVEHGRPGDAAAGEYGVVMQYYPNQNAQIYRVYAP